MALYLWEIKNLLYKRHNKDLCVTRHNNIWLKIRSLNLRVSRIRSEETTKDLWQDPRNNSAHSKQKQSFRLLYWFFLFMDYNKKAGWFYLLVCFLFLFNWVLGFNETKLNCKLLHLLISSNRSFYNIGKRGREEENKESRLSLNWKIWLQFPTLQQAFFPMLGKTLRFRSSKSLKGLIYTDLYWILLRRQAQIRLCLWFPPVKGAWTVCAINIVKDKEEGEELTLWRL